MLHSCWKTETLCLLLIFCCAPNTVLAQDEPTARGVELSPERAQSAPMPVAQPPSGTVVSGQITEAKAGRRLSRSGSLSIQFNDLRLPGGASFPISAHLLGSIGRYKDVNAVERGEGWKAKLGQLALRGGGAGLGAALGTGLGAIVDGGGGAGTGAWAIVI